jgi:glycosyltransferase involved in cell wall biosynthesis
MSRASGTHSGWLEDAVIALFVGGLYEQKRLRFLLRAGEEIARTDPRFQLIVIGSGPQEQLMRSAAERHDWLHYLGPRFGFDKAVALRAGRLLLIPGAVGLVAVDALVAGTPIVTTAGGPHGPEIDYVRDGDTGFVLPQDATPSSYARTVVDLMNARSDERDAIATRGAAIGQRLTIEAMSERFCTGILHLLAAGRV